MLRNLTAAAAALALAGSLAFAPATAQRADFEIALQPGETATVDSGPVAGANPGHFVGTDNVYPCGSTPAEYCQSILVHVTNPFDEADARKGRERANLVLDLAMDGVGDLALLVYEADADGTRGEQVGSSDGIGEGSESATVVVTTTEGDEERWYLVEVFFHAYSGQWSLDAALEG